MWEIVQAGGVLMWPIILCSIVAAAITLERLWTLQDRRVLPPWRGGAFRHWLKSRPPAKKP